MSSLTKKSKQQKNQKRKENLSSELISKVSKRKTYRRIDEKEEILKNKIIHYFMILDKQEVNSKELKWILVNLNYSRKEVESIVTEIEGVSGSEKFENNYLYKPNEVYGICERYPETGKWREEIFDTFSTNHVSVTLENLRQIWSETLEKRDPSLEFEKISKIFKEYEVEKEGELNKIEFEQLLKDINPFSKTI